MSQLIPLVGRVFGRWTVIRRADNVRELTYWWCRCTCSIEREVSASSLLEGSSTSCGCAQKDNPNRKTHGQSRTREYAVWSTAITRCFNESCPDYKYYGARGITMCEEWRHNFEAFIAYMGPCPRGLTLERVNNDGNYEPGNVVWATRKVQRNNQRRKG